MNIETNSSQDSDPREDVAYWREYARAEREHSATLLEKRVRANLLRANSGTR